MDKKQVQEAIARVDGLLGRARFSNPILNRNDHIQLVNDMQMIQIVCMERFDPPKPIEKPKEVEKKDGRTNIIPIRPKSDDEDSEGGGDSV